MTEERTLTGRRMSQPPLGYIGPEHIGPILRQAFERVALAMPRIDPARSVVIRAQLTRAMMPLELAMIQSQIKTARWIKDGRRRHGRTKHLRDRRRYLKKQLEL